MEREDQLKEDKPRWIRRKNGVCHNMSIGSNCRCWMCQAVMKWVGMNHFTTGKKRQKFANKLLDYLCYRMGYTGCEKTKTFDTTLPNQQKGM